MGRGSRTDTLEFLPHQRLRAPCRVLALAPASCPTEPFLAPRDSSPHNPVLPTGSTMAGHPQSPCCHPSQVVTSTEHKPDAHALWCKDRCTPEVPSSSCPISVHFTPPHPHLAGAGAPQTAAVARVLSGLCPTFPLPPPLWASLRAALLGAAVDSDFHQDFDN